MSQRASTAQGTTLGAEQLSVLLESARELVCILNADGIIVFASSGITRLLGHTTEDLVGESIACLVHPLDVAGMQGRFRELSTSKGGAICVRCRLQSKDGTWRWFEATASN